MKTTNLKCAAENKNSQHNVFIVWPFALLFIFSVAITSCKKKDAAALLPSEMRIDSTGANASATTFNPAKPLYTSDFTGNEQKFSFDVNGDNVNDISFTSITAKAYGGQVLFNYSLKLETLNNDTYILSDASYQSSSYDCHGLLSQSPVNEACAKLLSASDVIRVNDSWNQGHFMLLTYSLLNAPTDDPSYCEKHQVSGSVYNHKYIGVKCKGRLGWLKVQADYASLSYVYMIAQVK